jgi:hypothetical protein
VQVHFDGVYQGPDQYSLNGTQITFTSPIPSGVQKVYIVGGTTLSVNTPGNGSVGTVQLQDGAVTSPKIAAGAVGATQLAAGSVGNSQLAWGSSLNRVVDSIAALRALGSSTYLRAFVTGYYAAGDGGGGAYRVDATDTTSADNGGTIIVATDGARWKLINTSIVSVKQFGARGDDATDDTSAIQAALTWLSSVGGSIYLPSGTYKISASLNITSSNVRIFGDGPVSKIKTYSSALDIFVVSAGGGSSEIDNVTFANFDVLSSIAKTAGAAFKCTKIARARWDNVCLCSTEDTISPGNFLFNGIDLNQFDYCVINGGTIITTNEGVACNGDPSSLFGAGLFLCGGLKISGQSTGAGVHIGGGAGGIYFNDCDVIGNRNNVLIDTARQAGVANREIFFGGTCSLDSANNDAVFVDSNSVTHLQITGTWIASAGTSNSLGLGLNINSPNSTLVCKISGARFFNNAGGGIVINAGSAVISASEIYGNGYGASVTVGNGYGNGIWAPNTNEVGLVITGNNITNNGKSSAGAGSGILLAAGVANSNIQANTVRSNVAGQITDNSGAVNKLIANNLTT